MQAPTTVPLTITPEAEARVAELGMRRELEQMLAQVPLLIPDLVRLHVWLQDPYDTGDEPSVILQATRETTDPRPDDPTWNNWSTWKISSFPTDVWRHFAIMFVYGDRHGR